MKINDVSILQTIVIVLVSPITLKKKRDRSLFVGFFFDTAFTDLMVHPLV